MPIEKIATFVKPLKIPVEGKDLFVENDHVYMKTVKGPLTVSYTHLTLPTSDLV